MNSYTEWDNYQTNAEPMVSESADNKPNQSSDELPNNMNLQTAKHNYMNNKAKLNNSGKAQLQFYGRATLDALRGLNGENLDKDNIVLPEKKQFADAGSYYAIALHELGNWTGHESRLNRQLMNQLGSDDYAREELRTEISSMMINCELGMPHDPERHANLRE
ncbi:zincin-like metallopeptidase domain-containing protein [Snodgrassella alvi]|uniref:zincin-like metallopeptidase domain-containing protein n=1 Tax=Snodgrassella alvi TaxID=1196083 RepID=UPI000C1EAD2B|nr:zincin-like metallopeptidase domain-containing protein [Snodgrassella alvi]PIT42941.1 hypothetical protein BHC53_03140 [Snodgrassella alvi]